MMNLNNQPVTVVGGGIVALRKVEGLIDCGARVKIISIEFNPELRAYAAGRTIVLEQRPWQNGDLSGAVLAIAATNDPVVNEAVSHEARSLGIPVNVVDVPKLCSFYVPALYRNGDLCVAISSAGSAPMFSGQVRRYLEKSGIGDALGSAMLETASARVEMDKNPPATYEDRVKIMGKVVDDLFKEVDRKIRNGV